MIVSDNKITALDRQREGITFGEIAIPAKKPIDVAARNRVARIYVLLRTLLWRM